MNDDSCGELPTSAACLTIVLTPLEDLQADVLAAATLILLTSPLPGIPCEAPRTVAGARTLPAADPEFATCYHAEMPALISFLIRCGANHHDAADAAQEAFLQLFKQWPAVRKPRQWLRTVAFRIFLRQPAGNTVPFCAVQDIPSPLSASTPLELRQGEKFVLEILDLLPTTQRAVLALHYDQLETRDIAEIMGINQAAVRKNLERARAALKKLIEFSGEQPRLRLRPPAEGTSK